MRRMRKQLRSDRFIEDREAPQGHRFVLVHRLRQRVAQQPLVVLALNPAGNHEACFRASDTCRKARKFAEHKKFDEIIYLNLFSVTGVDPATALAEGRDLNHADADRRIIDQLRKTPGAPVVAAWGAQSRLSSEVRARLRDRAEHVLKLITKENHEIYCARLTARGHPAHPRAWRPDDELSLYNLADLRLAPMARTTLKT